MTKEQINIAIAKACGYKNVTIGVTEGTIRVVVGYKRHTFDEEIPDYCNDLNAMHEAEKMLTKEQLYNYGNKLDRITLPKTSMEMCYIESPEAGMYPDLFCATADQRAEAFLRTINKWEGGSDERRQG
jgi:hypothetical protein